VPQPPERCLSRQAGIVRYCLKAFCGFLCLLCAAAGAASGSGISAYSSSECSRTHLAICLMNASPYLAAFASPTPEMRRKSPMVRGLSSAISSRLTLLNTIYAGTWFFWASSLRRVFRLASSESSASESAVRAAVFLREARRLAWVSCAVAARSCMVTCSPWKSTAGALAVRVMTGNSSPVSAR